MKLTKIKLIFCPNNNYCWMQSHAANPVPYILNDKKEIVRIFFTTRDKNNKSYITYIDVDFKNNFSVINIPENPLLTPGILGTFDDSGVAMGCLIEKDDKLFLFYLGWNLKVTVPWMNTIGLSVAENKEIQNFKKYSMAPIMDRSKEDPFSISYPFIIFDEGKYKMWYGSNLSWGKNQSEMKHVIKYAESYDLINWNRSGKVHIPLIYANEYAISKPWVIKEENKFKMWYSFRANSSISTYRIGYAESKDGKTWERKDNIVGIGVSESGWDSEMICYPSIFTLNGNTFMLYNGNGYGKTGFGIAKFEL
jgi:hypothetical protein